MTAAWNATPPADLPYPFEALRHRYVTPCGGFSSDLYPGEVGVNVEALKANTDLEPFEDHVLVSSDLGGRRFPLFTRETFRIVPLDPERPDAYARSRRGEAVFSCFEDPTNARPSVRESLKQGIPVFLNAAMARRFGAREDATQSLIERMLQRKRQT